MASNSKQSKDIRRAQKESLLLKELSTLFLQLTMDDPKLANLSVHYVKLSPDGSMCSVFFYSSLGKEHFQEVLPTLILYKPSLRKALAYAIQSRYTPDLLFKFDKQFEKQSRIEEIFAKLKEEGQL